MKRNWRMLWVICLFISLRINALGEEKPHSVVDASSLRHKVLCGYQGWFRCPGDSRNKGWLHWSRNSRRISPDSLTFEMWPEMAEYDNKYPAAEFVHADGEQATLFSSADAQTVNVHFDWMRQHGIDGVFVQRFLVNLGDSSFDDVLAHARAAAARTGRVYAIGYDLSGTPQDRLYDRLTTDWKRLVEELKITQDDQYLHHNGKPVLFVWGFFDDRFGFGVMVGHISTQSAGARMGKKRDILSCLQVQFR
jgi:hypothetical protein